jgi:3-polyprenyl-4-hydroxybenzoate decarboxylase
LPVEHIPIASGTKIGIDATKKLPGEGVKRPWLHEPGKKPEEVEGMTAELLKTLRQHFIE